MRIITKESLCANIAERWAKAYSATMDDSKWGADKLRKHKELVALGGRGTPEQICAIIGNTSWVSNKCHECGADHDAVLFMGEDTGDYEDRNLQICGKCLCKAFKKMADYYMENNQRKKGGR